MDRLPALARVPIDVLDGDFEERLRRAPRDEQDRLLAEADRLREGADDDASWRCLTVYRALLERLDASSAHDLERAAWTCQEDPARDGVARRMAELALQHPGEEQRIEAACTLAQCELVAGHVLEAEARLRGLLGEVRSRGDRLEMLVRHALAVLYAAQHRELESLVLARRAEALAQAQRDLHPVHRAHAISVLGDAYRSLEDEERLAQTAERMRAVSLELSEPDATRLRRQAFTLAHEAAMLRGDLAAAGARLEEARREAARDLRTAGHVDDALAYYEARYALRTGHLDRAGAMIASHAGSHRAHATAWMLWALIEVEWLLRTGRPAEGVALAEGALTRMALPEVRQRLGTGRRLRNAERLAVLMEGGHGDAAVALLAYREAADAAFDRLCELDRCLRELPELAEADPEDREALAGYRARFVRRHRVTLDHLHDRMAAARVDGTLPAWATAAPGDMAAVCAWCRSVRTAEGRWLPLGHFVPSTGAQLTVTHGICEECRPRLGLG